MTVLVLGDPGDLHARVVLERLRARGQDAAFVDSRDFPARLGISHDCRGGGTLVLPDGRVVPWSDVRSVYWRNYNGVAAVPLPDPAQAHIAWNDSRSLFESWLIDLPAKWVNGWAGYQLHQNKPAALRRLTAAGVAIPPTLCTNDPHRLREFVSQHPRCIYKPVQGGASTRRLTMTDLTPDRLARLAIAPITVQAEIEGTNVRAFVAGDAVHAIEIATEAIDFRDDPRPRMRPHALPEATRELSRRIASTLELLWTGIDFRLTPQGEYVCLEANPSPMFLGFESATGLPLTDALIDLLL
jgi:hypothetical protein